jgi:hypothetical protein
MMLNYLTRNNIALLSSPIYLDGIATIGFPRAVYCSAGGYYEAWVKDVSGERPVLEPLSCAS